MIDFFDTVYSKIKDRNRLLKKTGFYSLFRLIVRVAANKILPLYFLATKNRASNSIPASINKNERTIATLTSFPGRISKVWLVVETILRQTKKPDEVVLWLSKEQFESMDTLPKILLSQQKRGLKIILKEGDLRSHKKYFYAIQEFINYNVITFDDDIFYPTNTIEELLEWHNIYPEVVIARYGTKIKTVDNIVAQYRLWEREFDNEGPSFKYFFGSGGGTLFPPRVLAEETINKDIFMRLCGSADDIWLNTMCRLNKKKIIITRRSLCSILPVLHKKNVTLSSSNYDNNLNDVQLRRVREYFLLNYGFDPFQL